jgi:uncharacterized Zn-binding protein involved in type VI secretion
MPGPAAFMGSLHVCPKFTGPVPHACGPVIGTAATVLIGVMPGAVLGDKAICVGPPDTVAMGSPTVLAAGKPLATMGSTCAHGGAIVLGMPTVISG